jgi:ribosomal-protein-alanine N-acetyltransferase
MNGNSLPAGKRNAGFRRADLGYLRESDYPPPHHVRHRKASQKVGLTEEPTMNLPAIHSPTKAQTPVHIRWMIRRDMPEVLGIESRSFEYPWSEDDFIRCLRQRNCIGMVAEHHERIVGFMIYELHKNRLHILNFAVHDQFRRRGVGTQMVRKLVGKLAPQRRNRIMLEVRETNLPAQFFFRDAGFKAISLLRDFYEDTTEDAYLMQLRYISAASEMPAERTRRKAG